MTLLILIMLSTTVYANDYKINTEEADKGIFTIETHFDRSGSKIKVLVISNNKKYVYDLITDDSTQHFPLQMGSGRYNILICEQQSSGGYKLICRKECLVNIEDKENVYTQQIKLINWDANSNTKLLTDQLVKPVITDREKILICYNYIIRNIDYDYNKIAKLDYDYIPDSDETLTTKSGICFDYSVLFATMLRSQGIPTKLIKGYTTNTTVYHAWNEVYLIEENRWMIIDTTFDAFHLKQGQTFDIEKTSENYTKQEEY